MLKGQARTDYMREYMRKRRAATKQSPSKSAYTDQRICELEARNRELEAELAKKAQPKPTPQKADTGPLESRIKELEAELALELKRTKLLKEALGRRPAKPAKPADEVKKGNQEAVKVAKLTAELAEAGPVTVETLTAALVKKEARIKFLTTRCKNLSQEVAWFALKPNARAMMMPKWLHRQIQVYIHPDQAHDDADAKRRTKCSQGFNEIDVIYSDG